jgi:hypothetical protein
MYRLIFAAATWGLVGCAGPSSPFGNLEINQIVRATKINNGDLNKSGTPNPLLSKKNFGLEPMLTTFPREQVLHKKFPLAVRIYDPSKLADRPKLNVFYDGIDVTDKFMQKATWHRISTNEIEARFNNLKISPSKNSEIRFIYTDSLGFTSTVYEFNSPTCPWDKMDPIENTDGFAVSPALKKLVEKNAFKAKINPNLLAGLIAQESGFDPKAVSFSKGIGLTQITPLAEAVVVEMFPHFPRFPDLNEFNPLKIKLLISLEHVNEEKEWRLNPTQSIDGGVAYLKSIREYWVSFERSRILASIDAHQYDETSAELSKLVLASYNSGHTRVRSEVNSHQKNWINSPQIQEAKKYVNLVSSYCSLFAQR